MKKSTQIGVILTAVYLCILPVLVVWHSYEHHHEHVHTNHDGPSVFEDVPSCDICDVTKHQKLILESNEDQNKELAESLLEVMSEIAEIKNMLNPQASGSETDLTSEGEE